MNNTRNTTILVLTAALLAWASAPLAAQEARFLRGDVNRDRVVDVSDPIALLLHLFDGGFEASCEKAADIDDNSAVELTDAVYGLAFLFQQGPPPPAPFGACGTDPTPDTLGCAEPPCGDLEGTVIISEIMASNAETLSDAEGDSPDWIELHLQDSAPDEVLDLGGWYLTQDSDLDDLWAIPAGATIERGGFLLILASGKDDVPDDSEIHADFRLDKDGEYLALVAPDGTTVVDELAPAFPPQLTDISWGPAQSTDTLVAEGDTVRYRVPASGDAGLGDGWTATGFDDGAWSTGRLGLGFTGVTSEGFDVTFVKANVTVDHINVASSVLSDPARQSNVVRDDASVIDYFNTGGRGNFPNDQSFPGIGFADVDDFVVHVTGAVTIPEAGPWSFGVNSDDGFRLRLAGGGSIFDMSHATPRGPGDTVQVFDLPQAGPYEVDLLYYERGGGAELEFFAARGSHASFNSRDFRLVGDTANGGLGLLGFAGDIATDLEDEMRGENTSVWMRAGFDVDDPGALGGLVLRAQYEDGFIAYLNGQEVARRNASGSPPAWDTAADSDRPLEDASLVEEVNLTGQIGALRNGRNILAIQGLNETVDDSDFLLQAELVAASRASARQYMETPTPGTFNQPGAVDFVRDIEFSVEHGFHDAAFPLALSTTTPDAEIRYTLDGSPPTPSTGAVYTGPVTIDETTVLRAAGFKPGHLDSRIGTQSYIFVSDVVRQSANGARPGPGWPSGSVNGQEIHYGMDPDVVNDPRWSGQIEEALLAIPTVSLVTDLANLFSPSEGIYVNARNDGRAWERPVSAELIHPDGTRGFTVDAGLRIRGAFSRSGSNPKHSLRLFFRSEYGPGRLEYPVHGGEGVDEFDKFDLRTSQNYSWAFQGSEKNTYQRDVFSRDAQRDMGQPYTRSRYFHVYLNGQYWGLFMTQERADREYARSYFGGDDDSYDVVKNDSSGSRALEAADGTLQAYRRLYDAAVAGFASDRAYLAVQGLQADGSPDPGGEKLLDPENLMDYMACTYYTGDPDAPVSAWAHFSNNVFGIYNREDPDGFKWFRHDAEHSLGANGGLFEGRLLTDATDRSIGEEWRHFNPAWLHLRLTQNDEYRLQFADRVNEYFAEGGVFSPQGSTERWMERTRQIELAVIAASARWGDSQRHPPRTQEDWQGQVDWMVNTFFPRRTQIVLDQMRSVNMFPETALVSFNRDGGSVDPGFRVVMSQGNGNPGTIYYTLDGTDPRLWGGDVQPDARVYEDDSTQTTLVAPGSVWRFLDDGSDQGTAWQDPGFDDASWESGPAELGYGDGGEATVVDFGPDPDDKFVTTYFRRAFSASNTGDVVELTLGIVVDDGAAVYLNGQEAVPRINLPSGTIGHDTLAEGPGVPVGGDDESRFRTFDVDPGLLVDGTNVLAVEVHQGDPGSSDVSFDLELTALSAGDGSSSIVIDDTTTVRARVLSGGEWGAETRARFTVGLDGLVINELMASNASTLEDPDEPGEHPDWVELYNGTSSTIDLGGMFLTDDPLELTQWMLADGLAIGPGEHLLIYADDDGTQGPLHTNYQLSRNGETLLLVERDGRTLIDAIVFDAQTEDVSFGRFPDGGTEWGFHVSPTPGAPNSQHTP